MLHWTKACCHQGWPIPARRRERARAHAPARRPWPAADGCIKSSRPMLTTQAWPQLGSPPVRRSHRSDHPVAPNDWRHPPDGKSETFGLGTTLQPTRLPLTRSLLPSAGGNVRSPTLTVVINAHRSRPRMEAGIPVTTAVVLAAKAAQALKHHLVPTLANPTSAVFPSSTYLLVAAGINALGEVAWMHPSLQRTVLRAVFSLDGVHVSMLTPPLGLLPTRPVRD